MKKTVSVFISIFVALALMSCHKQENPNSSQTPEIDTAPLTFQNMDEFLNTWLESQTDPSSMLFQNDEDNGRCLLIPNITSNEFEFYFAEAYGHNFFYYYVPKNYDKKFFDYTVGIIVSISKNNGTFSAVVEQYDLSVENGIAYDSNHNTWYIDFDSKLISICFPDSIVLQSGEELSNYFTFEEIAYNP